MNESRPVGAPDVAGIRQPRANRPGLLNLAPLGLTRDFTSPNLIEQDWSSSRCAVTVVGLLLATLMGCSGDDVPHVPNPAKTSGTFDPGPLTNDVPLAEHRIRYITNSIGMKFAQIPAGEFLMGSADADPGARDDEQPQHRVRISRPFYLGVYEVTQGSSRRLMETNPSSFTRQGLLQGLRRGASIVRGFRSTTSPGTPGRRVLPATVELAGGRRRPGASIACRPKRSGNTPAGPERRPSSTSATRSRRRRPTSTATYPFGDGRQGPVSQSHARPSVRTSPTRSACTTCTAT